VSHHASQKLAPRCEPFAMLALNDASSSQHIHVSQHDQSMATII